jgi:hypothetical protein
MYVGVGAIAILDAVGVASSPLLPVRSVHVKSRGLSFQ